jgi:para-nitrobenzyl esterase
VKQNQWSYIDAGQFPIQHMLIGNNANEAYAYLPAELSEKELAARINSTRYLDNPQTLRLIATDDDPRRALDRVLTADAYLCHSQAFAAAMNTGGGQAWMYQFSRVREGPGGEAWGAYHGTEYPYVFNTHDDWLPTAAADRKLTQDIMSYWFNFANDGDPNGELLPTWPEFGRDRALVQILDSAISSAPHPSLELCRRMSRTGQNQ